jgi:hypothetical protein
LRTIGTDCRGVIDIGDSKNCGKLWKIAENCGKLISIFWAFEKIAITTVHGAEIQGEKFYKYKKGCIKKNNKTKCFGVTNVFLII